MRKFLTFLLLSLMTTMAWGVKIVTFIPGEVAVPTDPGDVCMSRDCVTICCSNGWFNANQFRFYKGSTVTATSTCGPIIKIEFVCIGSGDAQYGPGCFTATPGDYSYEDKTGVWEGASTQVQFTAVTNQVRAVRIDVYVDEGAVYPPKITPAGGTYFEPVTVTMTCQTEGANIYYTLTGISVPTTASTQYTGPFTLESDAKVQAIAELDGEVSYVARANYVILDPVVVNSIAEYQMLDDETTTRFANPVYVTAQNNRYLYVKDNTGYAVFYGDCGQTYVNGDEIPAGFYGNKTTYSCEPELNHIGCFQPAASNSPIDPELITADQIGPATFAHYVMMKNVTLSAEENETYILTDAEGNSCQVYFRSMGATPPIDLTRTYDIIGVVGSYGHGDDCFYQLLPTRVLSSEPLIGFGLLEDIDDETELTMDYDATVIAQTGNYLYAFDQTGYGLVYGSTGHAYKMGDVIPAGFGGKKNTYNCEPELMNPHDFQAPIATVTLEAEEITIDEVNHSTWGHYVVLRNVRFNPADKFILDQEGNSCNYFNRFGIEIPEDSETVCDVYGVVGSWRSSNSGCIYQILPLRIGDDYIPPKVCCIEDLLRFPKGRVVEFECPLIVVYQSGVRLYVKDKCDQYTLICGHMDGTFAPGDSIIGCVSWTLYPSTNGFVQLVPVGDWQLVAHGPAIPPQGPFAIEDITQDMIHMYIYFEDMTVTKKDDSYGDRYYTMSDEWGSEMQLYNQLGIEIPTGDAVPYGYGDVNDDGEVNIIDVNAIIYFILYGKYDNHVGSTNGDGENKWEHCRVEGFLSMYHNEFELFPSRVAVTGGGGNYWPPEKRYDLNNDGIVNISDLNIVIGLILK